jgi:hypothetical protein
MKPSQKDTVYIDTDDEITSIIDKISSADAKIVAVVLPKRATMLQSSVNMKLLKKAADKAKKHVALITSEASLLPLAGLAGLHVAKTLQSKPEIPEGVEKGFESVGHDYVDASEDDSADFDTKSAANQPIGVLAGLSDEPVEEAKKVMPELTPLPIPRAASEDAAIEIDNSDEEEEAEAAKEKEEKPIDKKLKVPNFEKFRLWLILGFLLIIVLIVGFILANSILPKATVTVYTKTSSLNNTFTLTLDSTATAVNTGTSTVPAQIQQTQKTASQQETTTGQKNEGSVAAGSITMTAYENCENNKIPQTPPSSVPAGTGVTVNGYTYITQQNTTFPSSGGFHDPNDDCYDYPSAAQTQIAALNPGTAYNIQNGTFKVNGRSDVSATGSASGGTDNNVRVVSQTDINNAEQQLSTTNTAPIKSALSSSLQQAGLIPIPGSFTAGQPTITTSANVGDQANTVTVTEATTYSMFGVKNSYLQTVVNSVVDKQINTSSQSIINDGLTNLNFTVVNQSATGAQVTFPETATIGPQFDLASLKKQIEGKKAGDVRTIIEASPGVTSVNVHYSPFWVSTTPKNVNKIIIDIKKSS